MMLFEERAYKIDRKRLLNLAVEMAEMQSMEEAVCRLGGSDR
jgi:hypothetical protein